MTLTNTSNFQRFFMESGYYLLKGVIEDELVRLAYQDSIKSTDWEAEGHCVSNKEGKIIKVYELYQRNIDSFRKIIFDGVLLDHLEIILGPNILFLKNRHNCLVFNRKDDFPKRFHRDVLQWSSTVVTAIVYLEDTTNENGATLIIPNTHKWNFVGVPQKNGGGTWMDEHREFDGLEDNALPIFAKAGDVLLFDGTLFHSTGVNQKYGTTRVSLILGYMTKNELIDMDTNHTVLVRGEDIYRGNVL